MRKLFPVILLCFIVCGLSAQNQPAERLLAGAAEAVINPPNESFLAGYSQQG